MNRTTLYMIQEALSDPLDENLRIMQDIDLGIIRTKDSRALKRLKNICQKQYQSTAHIRTRFLEAVIIENRPLVEAVVQCYAEIGKLKSDYYKLLETLKVETGQGISIHLSEHVAKLVYPESTNFTWLNFEETLKQLEKMQPPDQPSKKTAKRKRKSAL